MTGTKAGGRTKAGKAATTTTTTSTTTTTEGTAARSATSTRTRTTAARSATTSTGSASGSGSTATAAKTAPALKATRTPASKASRTSTSKATPASSATSSVTSTTGPEQRRYFLVKGEGESRIVAGVDVRCTIDDLEAQGEVEWEGVRNYEARNVLNEMRPGDTLLYYHSNCKKPGIAGLATVRSKPHPDISAQQPGGPYYDPKATPAAPRWTAVRVGFVTRFARFLPLDLLREHGAPGHPLASMVLLRRGRLSVQRVTPAEYAHITSLLQ